jgi:hypothetical protein
MSTGLQVSALFRAYLNKAGIPWSECERIGREFNAQVESAAWLETDRGSQFDLTEDKQYPDATEYDLTPTYIDEQ